MNVRFIHSTRLRNRSFQNSARETGGSVGPVVESWAVGISAWGEGVQEHIRAGDSAALLADIRAALAPLGLYPEAPAPGAATQSEPGESEEETTR